MAEEDSLMNEAVELMNQWKVPADFREFVADCCNFGGGAVDWVREVDVRRWSLQLLKAAIADGSVFSGEWDSLSCSAVLPVPMPAFMLPLRWKWLPGKVRRVVRPVMGREEV